MRDVVEDADVALRIAHERAERSVGLLLHHQVQRERVVARRDHTAPAIGASGRQRHGRCVTETMYARRRGGPLSRDPILIESALERAGVIGEREAELGAARLHLHDVSREVCRPSGLRSFDEQRATRVRSEPLLRFPQTGQILGPHICEQ